MFQCFIVTLCFVCKFEFSSFLVLLNCRKGDRTFWSCETFQAPQDDLFLQSSFSLQNLQFLVDLKQFPFDFPA